MSTNTENLNLFKYDVEKDAKLTFNIENCLNQNWDKIDDYLGKKGKPNGYASLDSSGKVPEAQLPELNKGSGFNLFDTKLSDHILEGEEGFGWALQGTYTLSSYTDFYQKCLAEKNSGVATQTTLGESTITTYNNANGHIFYDIADKAVVDTYYEKTGSAWFYGIDTENERIFLPRNKWIGIKGINNTVPVKGNGNALFLTNGTTGGAASLYATSGATRALNFSASGAIVPIGTDIGPNGTNLASKAVGVTPVYDSGLIANTSDVIKVDTEKYLYICVGNTMVNEADVDVANLTTDVQNLEANKANKTEVPSLAAPSTRFESLTLGASGTTYIAPAAGYFTMNAQKLDQGQVILREESKKVGYSRWMPAGGTFSVSSSIVQAGDVVTLAYDGTINLALQGTGFWFVYAEGSKGVV